MSQNPLVSVVIPTYNRSRLVLEAVDSVLSQTYRNIEVIVVDDGSTDDTLNQLATYGDRIRVLTQDNAGPAAARNRGIATCHGDLVAFLDSDDLWMLTKVERQVSLLLRAGTSVPCCLTNIRMMWSDTTFTSFEKSWLGCALDEGIWLNVSEVLATRFVLFNQAIMIRRKVLEKVGGFDNGLRLLEDGDLAMRLSFEGPWAFIQEPLVIWRETRESLYQEARKAELQVKETLIEVLEKSLLVLNGNTSPSVRRLLAAELKRARRELTAAQLSKLSSRTSAAAGSLLTTLERWRRAAFRRSPWFPKMQAQPLQTSPFD